MESIILPLDGFNEYGTIMHILGKVQEAEMQAGDKVIWGFKVNDALIQYGVHIIKKIKEYGFRVFADPKLDDIPKTVSNSLYKLIDAGADIISVKCSAQYKPIEDQKQYITGITVLTSMDEKQCRYVYGESIKDTVIRFYSDVKAFGYHSLVCSAKDLSYISFDDPLLKITPGIRPKWYQKKDDQKRVATPVEAIKMGADLLVIGRPILNDRDMVGAISRTNEEIAKAQEIVYNEKSIEDKGR